MARTHRDRGHMPPVDGIEERLDALLALGEELLDLLRPAAPERPGEVRLRELGVEPAAPGGETASRPPAARPAARGRDRRR